MNYLAAVFCLAIGGLDGYQAITGRRLSKRPSRRTDHQMRVQSTIAAVALVFVGGLALATAIAK
jgi:hypothetical protein